MNGQFLYNEQPIGNITSASPTITLSEYSSHTVVPTDYTFDISTGYYTIANMQEGTYIITAYVDSAPPFSGFSQLPGDFQTLGAVVEISEEQDTIQQDLILDNIIHLNSPVDNRDKVMPYGTKHTYSEDEIHFAWETISGVAYYIASVSIYQESTNAWLRNAWYEKITATETWISLPISLDNEYYSFGLKAYNVNDSVLGRVFLTYSPTGSDAYYRF